MPYLTPSPPTACLHVKPIKPLKPSSLRLAAGWIDSTFANSLAGWLDFLKPQASKQAIKLSWIVDKSAIYNLPIFRLLAVFKSTTADPALCASSEYF
jgi:hypothetical protein